MTSRSGTGGRARSTLLLAAGRTTSPSWRQPVAPSDSRSTPDRPRALRRSVASSPTRPPPRRSTAAVSSSRADSALSASRRARTQHADRAEQRQGDRAYPQQAWFVATGDADGEIGHPRWKRQRLVDVIGPFSGASHDLLHGNKRRVPGEQAIGQPQRGDLGNALVAWNTRAEIRQARDTGSCPQVPQDAV